MPVITEGLNLGDLLKYEAPNLYSRDQVTVAAGQNLVLGTVVGIDAATGKVKQIDPAATDGTEVAVGVLAQEDLAHMPEVLFGFGALVDGEVGGRPRVTVQADLVVLGEVVVERRLPGALAVAPALVHHDAAHL